MPAGVFVVGIKFLNNKDIFLERKLLSSETDKNK